MTLTVFCILLFAALLHASWNAIVKASGDKMYAAIGVSGSAALIALVMLPFAPAARAGQRPLSAGVVRVTGGVYGAGGEDLPGIGYEPDLSADARTAPLLVAAISVLFLGDRLSPLAWLGIGVICLAILAMAFNGRASSRKGIVLALINACFIAGYTLVDGTGVRLAGSALGYTLWTFFMNGFCLLCWAMVARRREASRYLRQHWKKGILAGSAPWAPTAWRYGR
ncbi:integral membrane protein [Klebsiella pneumoniae]|uniref:Integral membrane protein n=1 Tax=Klebsiella pneumoniae TaxID=573 RepID=A0A2X3CVS8_KLEPN|nr:integral membrane protein [Klebsiella pneumoniae]